MEIEQRIRAEKFNALRRELRLDQIDQMEIPEIGDLRKRILDGVKNAIMQDLGLKSETAPVNQESPPLNEYLLGVVEDLKQGGLSAIKDFAQNVTVGIVFAEKGGGYRAANAFSVPEAHARRLLSEGIKPLEADENSLHALVRDLVRKGYNLEEILSYVDKLAAESVLNSVDGDKEAACNKLPYPVGWLERVIKYQLPPRINIQNYREYFAGLMEEHKSHRDISDLVEHSAIIIALRDGGNRKSAGDKLRISSSTLTGKSSRIPKDMEVPTEVENLIQEAFANNIPLQQILLTVDKALVDIALKKSEGSVREAADLLNTSYGFIENTVKK